jgi:hypothetical protein
MSPTAPARTALRRTTRAALAAAALLLGGCATIFTGSSDRITFDANVTRVRLSIDGEPQGELPVTIDVSRRAVEGGRFLARFERQGYLPLEVELTRSFNPVALLDLPVFLVGLPVDWLTGSLWQFEPTSYFVRLLPDPSARGAPSAGDLVCRAERP